MRSTRWVQGVLGGTRGTRCVQGVRGGYEGYKVGMRDMRWV